MINQIEENLEGFRATEMWKPAHYQWLLEFLDNEERRKIFFWIEGDDVSINFTVPQKFFGKSNLRI